MTEAEVRKKKAYNLLGVSVRTLQRWEESSSIKPDGRPGAKRPTPKNKLSDIECETIIQVCNQPE